MDAAGHGGRRPRHSRGSRSSGGVPLLVLVLALSGLACGDRSSAAEPSAHAVAPGPGAAHAAPAAGTARAEQPAPGHFEVPPPPFSDGIFPCSDCHEDMDVDPTRRTLEDEHESIVLRHDEEHRWCLDCHDPEDRDKLRLASGERIDFRESYRLCGQCHGDKYRDWRAGVHGKRTGRWDGEKRYLLCAHCHDPHAPRFQPIEPLPAPRRPEEIR